MTFFLLPRLIHQLFVTTDRRPAPEQGYASQQVPGLSWMKNRCPRYSPFVCACVGGGGVVTNDWCIIYRNKDEILDKVFVFFISFVSPILYTIIKEAKHNRLVISAPHLSASPQMGKGHVVLVPIQMIGIVVSVTVSCFRDLMRSDGMAELLALSKSDHGVSDSNPADGKILSEAKRLFIAHGLSCLPFHCPGMTEIRLKGT